MWYSQSCCASVLAKHSLKRQCMVWQKLSRRDFGETYRHLDSGTLSGSSVKLSQVSWIISGSSCWNTWTHTHTHTHTREFKPGRQNSLHIHRSVRCLCVQKCQYTIRCELSIMWCSIQNVWTWEKKWGDEKWDINGGYLRLIWTRFCPDERKSKRAVLWSGTKSRLIAHRSVFSFIFQTFGESKQMCVHVEFGQHAHTHARAHAHTHTHTHTHKVRRSVQLLHLNDKRGF